MTKAWRALKQLDGVTMALLRLEAQHLVQFGIKIAEMTATSIFYGVDIARVEKKGQEILDRVYGPDWKILTIKDNVISLEPGKGHCVESVN